MIELIREQKSGPLFPMKWWKINNHFTVNATYEDNICYVSIVNNENESITDQFLEKNSLKIAYEIENAPLGGALIKIPREGIDDLLIELESTL